VRLGDKVLSICLKPSGPFIKGSSRTFIDARPAIRLGDLSIPGIAITGSSKTLIDGRPAVRQIDRVFCGVIISASSKTYIG
jgi:uncharacterized Zn-binding protein involved in type VI secretion